MVKSIYATPEKNGERKIPPFLVTPQPPLDSEPFGVSARAIIPGADTDYQYAGVETALAPQTLGPSPHFHKRLDELAYVLEGTLSVMVEQTVHEVSEGSMCFRPRGLVHTFWNATDRLVRFLDMFFNQNLDEYLDEFFRLIGASDETDSGQLPEKLAALDAEFDAVVYHDQRQAIIDKYGLKG